MNATMICAAIRKALTICDCAPLLITLSFFCLSLSATQSFQDGKPAVCRITFPFGGVFIPGGKKRTGLAAASPKQILRKTEVLWVRHMV
jgi:hypothetical protein